MWGLKVSRAPKPKGFTLIELLMVAVMLGIVGLAIVATFGGGLKIFYRVESHTATQSEVLLSLEKMEKDLKNTFAFKGMDFIGEAKKVTFPATLRTVFAKNKITESLGLVSYYRDDSHNMRTLSREEKTYIQAAQKENPERGDIMTLAPIEDIQFQYFSYDPESKTYSWISAWDRSEVREKEKKDGKVAKEAGVLEDRPEDLPLGVKIKISYKDGDKTLTLDRTVFIKTAVSLNLAKIKAKAEKHNAQEVQREP